MPPCFADRSWTGIPPARSLANSFGVFGVRLRVCFAAILRTRLFQEVRVFGESKVAATNTCQID